MKNRIPYGEETRFDMTDMPPICGDCHAALQELHVPGCDIEECPECHGQKISCRCHVKPKEMTQEQFDQAYALLPDDVRERLEDALELYGCPSGGEPLDHAIVEAILAAFDAGSEETRMKESKRSGWDIGTIDVLPDWEKIKNSPRVRHLKSKELTQEQKLAAVERALDGGVIEV